MFVRRWLVRATGFVALVATLGCSQGSGNLATVSGVVTQNGAPLDGVKVIFHSTVEAEGKRPDSYAALTDSAGMYLIAQIGKNPGIPPGMYKVTVIKLEQKGNLPTEGFDEGQLAASGMARNLLPKDYENPITTKLSVTLEAGKNENKNFDLKPGASSGKPAAPIP
jgi:hypothetical protein